MRSINKIIEVYEETGNCVLYFGGSVRIWGTFYVEIFTNDEKKTLK